MRGSHKRRDIGAARDQFSKIIFFGSCLQNRNVLVAHPLYHQDNDSKQQTENERNIFVIYHNKATAAALSSYM